MIPVNEPQLNQRDLDYVTECIRTGWVSSQGRFIEAFEEQWAAYCGVRYGVAVTNGTVALELAIASLHLAPGDEVIMPSFTIISCALALIYNDAVPVLVDADPRTWCMDVRQLESKITPRTKAIMPVHIYGHPVDMDPVRALARAHHLVVIEDAAEAHGAEYKKMRCGGIGDLGCFSFYANKIVTTGEGGMVVTSDRARADELRSLRNLCFRSERRFYHTTCGYNARLTNMQAALGVAQTERIEELVAHKRWMGALYTSRLAGASGLQLPVEEPWATNVYWMYGIVLDERARVDATTFAARLAARGVMTRPFFLGMHEQPALLARGLFRGERYPVSERLARQGLYVPSGLTLTEQQIHEVCDVLIEEWNKVRP